MKKYLVSLLVIYTGYNTALSQEVQEVTLEIAPYRVSCNDNRDVKECLQVLDNIGNPVAVIARDGIQNFNPEQGFEYTITAQDLFPNGDKKTDRYVLKNVVSKMWIPQYAINAPQLNGNFQVIGINGRAIDPSSINLVINANNSVMRGSTGCNNYHLFFEQIGYSLVFSKILASHLFCDQRSALEEEYFVIFNSVHHFDLKGDVLRLYDITDRMLLEANLLR